MIELRVQRVWAQTLAPRVPRRLLAEGRRVEPRGVRERRVGQQIEHGLEQRCHVTGRVALTDRRLGLVVHLLTQQLPVRLPRWLVGRARGLVESGIHLRPHVLGGHLPCERLERHRKRVERIVVGELLAVKRWLGAHEASSILDGHEVSPSLAGHRQQLLLPLSRLREISGGDGDVERVRRIEVLHHQRVFDFGQDREIGEELLPHAGSGPLQRQRLPGHLAFPDVTPRGHGPTEVVPEPRASGGTTPGICCGVRASNRTPPSSRALTK
jgi:hypothetical protein